MRIAVGERGLPSTLPGGANGGGAKPAKQWQAAAAEEHIVAVQTVDIAFHMSIAEHYSPSKINLKEDGSIVVEFMWRGDRYTYAGQENPKTKGKFRLTCPALNGTATLYKLPGDEGWMGRWSEGGQGKGLWEIDLAE